MMRSDAAVRRRGSSYARVTVEPRHAPVRATRAAAHEAAAHEAVPRGARVLALLVALEALRASPAQDEDRAAFTFDLNRTRR